MMDLWYETEVRMRHAELLAAARKARLRAERVVVRRSLRHACADVVESASVLLAALARAVRGTQSA